MKKLRKEVQERRADAVFESMGELHLKLIIARDIAYSITEQSDPVAKDAQAMDVYNMINEILS